MKCRYEKRQIVGPSFCDHKSALSIPSAFDLFMDMAAEHAEGIGVGAGFMMQQGMFWLTAKTRIHMYKRAYMMQDIILETWPLKPRGVQEIRDYRIKDSEGNLIAEGKTQWAMMNMKTGGLVKFDEFFPSGIDFVEESVLDEPFARISEDISDCAEFSSYSIRSVDIDLGGHMNNVAYVRALFGAFDSKELDEMKIRDCEICYKHSCYEGDKLTFYKRKTGSGLEIVVKNSGGETAIMALLR